MSQFAAQTRSILQPAPSDRGWRVVNADGSLTSFRDTRAMGAVGLEIMERLPRPEPARPNAGMPAAGDELDSFVAAARKTGLYQRLRQEQEAMAVKPKPEKNAAHPPETPPHLEAIVPATVGDIAAATDNTPPTLLAVPPQASPPDAAESPPSATHADANLARVIDLWPELPLGIRAGILAMVEATIAEKSYTRTHC